MSRLLQTTALAGMTAVALALSPAMGQVALPPVTTVDGAAASPAQPEGGAAPVVQANPANLGPAIPAEIMAAAQRMGKPADGALQPPAPEPTPAGGGSAGEGDAASPNPVTVTSRPGINEVVMVAVGHLNRVITPFPTPKVMTTSDATVQIKDNVIYVAPADDRPVTMFITPEDDQSLALSLTLAPRAIAPREIRVQLPSTTPLPRLTPDDDTSEAGGYVQGLKDAFRALALQEVPSGYGFRTLQASDVVPLCDDPRGLEFQFPTGQSQKLAGSQFEITVGVVRNASNQPVELKESACQHPLLAAVAFWPQNRLEPGESAEVYVANRRSYGQRPVTSRPSLVEASHGN